ncbi:MAG TPA: hypothetical protein VG757_03270 [Devosia sp.]|nr:hypothetical protein [Devosia sp.]
MTMLHTIKTTGRAALVAVALGATAFTAMPVQAAEPSGSFSLQFGNGGGPKYFGHGFGFGFGNGNGSIQLHFGDRDFFNYCLTNRQIERGLDNRGFDRVRIVKSGERKVIAVGKWGSRWYEMRVDRCTGKVDRVKRVNQRPNGSFSITLNF